MINILIIHGPNLHLLGKREKGIYGTTDLKTINKKLGVLAKRLKIKIDFFQSNHEGEIEDTKGKAEKTYDAIVINPAAYTHTSVAIRDAVSAINIPVVEVHLSNIYSREEFRRKSLISAVAKGTICGFGVSSYALGLEAAVDLCKKG